MNTPTHTPRPWRKVTATTGSASHYIGQEVILPGSGVTVMRVVAQSTGGPISAEERLANEYLISAAPDLLAAAEQLVKDAAFCDRLEDGMSTTGPGMTLLRAAIAKALGEVV